MKLTGAASQAVCPARPGDVGGWYCFYCSYGGLWNTDANADCELKRREDKSLGLTYREPEE
jgi:hypothetical protein